MGGELMDDVAVGAAAAAAAAAAAEVAAAADAADELSEAGKRRKLRLVLTSGSVSSAASDLFFKGPAGIGGGA